MNFIVYLAWALTFQRKIWLVYRIPNFSMQGIIGMSPTMDPTAIAEKRYEIFEDDFSQCPENSIFRKAIQNDFLLSVLFIVLCSCTTSSMQMTVKFKAI